MAKKLTSYQADENKINLEITTNSCKVELKLMAKLDNLLLDPSTSRSRSKSSDAAQPAGFHCTQDRLKSPRVGRKD